MTGEPAGGFIVDEIGFSAKVLFVGYIPDALENFDIDKSERREKWELIKKTEETKMHPSTNGGIEQVIYELFEQYAKSHEGTRYVYLGTKNGEYIQWSEDSTYAGYDPTKRPWYTAAVNSKANF
jgi:hypothetical protein